MPMEPVMTGQGHDQLSGVQGLLTRGQEDHREVAPAVDLPTALDLLAGTPPVPAGRHVTVRPADVEIVIAPDWLADLHDPTLVITRGYVGPERRRTDRGAPGYAPTTRTLRSSWFRRIAQIVCMTVAVAVPLTLIAARSVPPATDGASPSASAGVPKATGPSARRGAPTFTASPQQVARADAAYQRALVRQQATVGTASGGPGATAAQTVGATSVMGPKAAHVAAAAQARATAEREATQARAEAQAAAAVRRAEAQAARAEAQAAKGSGSGHHPGGGTSATPPGS
jgi:hypothetical protein